MTHSNQIHVLVHGALGKMGREVVARLCAEPDLRPVAGVDRLPRGDALNLPDGSSIPYFTDVRQAIAETKPRVLVDFTSAEGCMSAATPAAEARVHLVIGSTGLSEADLRSIDGVCQRHGVGGVVAPNFALGAVLLIHLARTAAPFFEYADIAEMHHEAKVDAPSGTALAIAQAMAEEEKRFCRPMPRREPVSGTRGGDYRGISVHSTRMPGRLAHHEVVLGAPGQTLTLRHDTINRECCLPGVIMAIRDVVRRKGLVVGLDKVMGL